MNPWILGNGHEYKILDLLKDNRKPVILPLNCSLPIKRIAYY